MNALRVLLIASAVVMAGTIASAAASGGDHRSPTQDASVAVSESPTPTETKTAEPSETEAARTEERNSDRSGAAPDFSGCNGLTGLENATCRHQALLREKPHNQGLTNSLTHLNANAAAFAARPSANAAHTQGKSNGHGSRSDDAPGSD